VKTEKEGIRVLIMTKRAVDKGKKMCWQAAKEKIKKNKK